MDQPEQLTEAILNAPAWARETGPVEGQFDHFRGSSPSDPTPPSRAALMSTQKFLETGIIDTSIRKF